MRRIFSVGLMLIGLSSCSDGKPVASDETSPAGISFHLIPMPGQKQVAIQAAWATDWAYHDGRNHAVPYVASQLLLSGGAEGYPAGKAVELLADLQAQVGLTPKPDYLYGTFLVPKNHLDDAAKIVNAHLKSPTLDGDWLKRIRHQLTERLTELYALPAAQAASALRWAIFGNQPLREAINLDKVGTIESVTADEVRQWQKQVIGGSMPTIVVAGDISAKEAGLALDTLLDGLSGDKHDIDRSVETNFKPRTILVHMKDAAQAELMFIASLPPVIAGGEMEDVIATQALGGDDQSLLFKAVRTELRASYGFGAYQSNFARDLQYFLMTGSVETSKLAQARDVVAETYSDFRMEGLNGDISARAAYLTEQTKQVLESPSAKAYSALTSLLDGDDIGYLGRLPAAIAKVTNNSIRERLKNTYPEAGQLLVVAVSPDADALPGACVIERPEDAVKCP